MGRKAIQELTEALAALHQALQQDIDSFERAGPEELPLAAERRHERMLGEAAPAVDALEALISNELYAEDWVEQIKLYAAIGEAILIAEGDWLRGREYVRPAIDALGHHLDAVRSLLDRQPKAVQDEKEKYAAALYVMAWRLADWADHKLPELDNTRNYCLSLELVVVSVGPLDEYCRWMESIGHPAWGGRIEREWEKLTDDALEADNSGDDGEEATLASNLEDDAFGLSYRLASIALLLGAPSYDPYYHGILGLCPTRRTGSIKPSSIAARRRRRAGRPKVAPREAKQRLAVLQAWTKARDAGVSRRGFCEDWNENHPSGKPLSVNGLEKIAGWARQRRIRGDGSR